MSVRTQILALTVGVVVCAVVSLSVLTSRQMSDQLEDHLEEKSLSIHCILASNIGPGIEFNDLNYIEDVARGAFGDSDIFMISVFDMDKQKIYERTSNLYKGSIKSDSLPDISFTNSTQATSHSDLLLVDGNIHSASGRTGWIRIVVSTRAVANRIASNNAVIAFVALLAISILFLVTWVFSNRIVRPIKSFVIATNRVSLGQLDKTVEIGRFHRDFLPLASAYNKMQSDLSFAFDELTRMNEELEERVEQRTQELKSEIEDRKLAQLSIEENERRFRSLIENGNDIITILDIAGTILYASPSIESILGYSSEELLGNNVFDLIHEEDRDSSSRAFDGLIKDASSTAMCECRYRHKDGSWRYLEASGRNLVNDPTVNGIVINSRDITYRTIAEEQIRASLREKETLLKEIHHRVKNNLQIISSLLNLQSNQISDHETQQLFRDSMCRVKSMALIHERLYSSEDLGMVDISGYVKSLTSFLMATVSGNLERISIHQDVDETTLPVDAAVPCGLIINELVTNSMKYAFPNTEHGEIAISFHRLDNRTVRLSVRDNGIGLPEDLDIKNTQSLGMHLIHSLADQLDGKLTFDCIQGTQCTIEFESICANSEEREINETQHISS